MSITNKINYLLGLFKSLASPRTSMLSMIDGRSQVHSLAKINRFVKLSSTKVGRYSYIGPRTHIKNTDIGSFCSISWDCNIGLENHDTSYISTSPIFLFRNNGTGSTLVDQDCPSEASIKTKIGNDVWIGANAMVIEGVEIGDGAVIGAGAIVTKSVPPYAIVVGAPAKIIRFRFAPETIEKLIELEWWNLTDEKLKSNISAFQNSDISAKDINDLIKNIKG